MNNCLNYLQIKDIEQDSINWSKEFCLLYSVEKNYLPFFFFTNDRYYPVFYKTERISNKQIKAITCSDKEAVTHFILSLRGTDNLSFADKLFIFRFNENNPFFNNTFQGNLKKYIPLLNLPEIGLDLLHHNRLSPDLGLKLLTCSTEDICTFLELVDKLKLNINQQKELFDFFMLQSGKHHKSFKESAVTFLNSENRENLMKQIRKIALPAYTETLEKFTILKKRLSLKKNINLVETPFFETRTLKIELFFKSYPELKGLVESLQENIETKKDDWNEIFSIL